MSFYKVSFFSIISICLLFLATSTFSLQTLPPDDIPAYFKSKSGRITVIGDTQGDPSVIYTIFRHLKYIDAEGKWIGGAIDVVIMGDFTGGPDSLLNTDLITALSHEAARHGARIHIIGGNHELYSHEKTMTFSPASEKGRLRRWFKGGFSGVVTQFKRYTSLFIPINTIITIDDMSFMHGGFDDWLERHSPSRINATMRAWLNYYRKELRSNRWIKEPPFSTSWIIGQDIDGLEDGKVGPLFTRALAKGKLSLEKFNNILTQYGWKKVFIAHKTTPNGRIFRVPIYGGRVIMTDTALAREKSENRNQNRDNMSIVVIENGQDKEVIIPRGTPPSSKEVRLLISKIRKRYPELSANRSSVIKLLKSKKKSKQTRGLLALDSLDWQHDVSIKNRVAALIKKSSSATREMALFSLQYINWENERNIRSIVVRVLNEFEPNNVVHEMALERVINDLNWQNNNELVSIIIRIQAENDNIPRNIRDFYKETSDWLSIPALRNAFLRHLVAIHHRQYSNLDNISLLEGHHWEKYPDIVDFISSRYPLEKGPKFKGSYTANDFDTKVELLLSKTAWWELKPFRPIIVNLALEQPTPLPSYHQEPPKIYHNSMARIMLAKALNEQETARQLLFPLIPREELERLASPAEQLTIEAQLSPHCMGLWQRRNNRFKYWLYSKWKHLF